jgi:hypothetical protein
MQQSLIVFSASKEATGAKLWMFTPEANTAQMTGLTIANNCDCVCHNGVAAATVHGSCGYSSIEILGQEPKVITKKIQHIPVK